MTQPDREQPNRDQELENIVDQLDENVAGEREAEGVCRKPSDRERTAAENPQDEPPD